MKIIVTALALALCACSQTYDYHPPLIPQYGDMGLDYTSGVRGSRECYSDFALWRARHYGGLGISRLNRRGVEQ